MGCITDESPVSYHINIEPLFHTNEYDWSLTRIAYPAEDFEDFVTAHDDEFKVRALAGAAYSETFELILT